MTGFRFYMFSLISASIFVMVSVPTVWASPKKPGLQSTTSSVVHMVIALAIVLLLIGVLVRFLAKRSTVRQRGSIEILAARQLATNRSVQVIEVGEKQFLVGVGENITMLSEITDSYDSLSEPDQSLGETLGSVLDDLRSHRTDGGSRQN